MHISALLNDYFILIFILLKVETSKTVKQSFGKDKQLYYPLYPGLVYVRWGRGDSLFLFFGGFFLVSFCWVKIHGWSCEMWAFLLLFLLTSKEGGEAFLLFQREND